MKLASLLSVFFVSAVTKAASSSAASADFDSFVDETFVVAVPFSEARAGKGPNEDKPEILETMENKLAKNWNRTVIPGQIWGYQAAFKCSVIIVDAAFADDAVDGAWSKFFDLLQQSNNYEKYPRLAACLLTQVFVPPSLSKWDNKKAFELRTFTMADSLLSRMNTLATGRLFQEDLTQEILLGLEVLNPKVCAELSLKYGRIDVLHDLIEDSQRAWEARVLFSSPKKIVSSAKPVEAMEFLKYLDVGMTKFEPFKFDLFLGAIELEGYELIPYLEENYKTVSQMTKGQEEHTRERIAEKGSMTMMLHLENLGFRGFKNKAEKSGLYYRLRSC